MIVQYRLDKITVRTLTLLILTIDIQFVITSLQQKTPFNILRLLIALLEYHNHNKLTLFSLSCKTIKFKCLYALACNNAALKSKVS